MRWARFQAAASSSACWLLFPDSEETVTLVGDRSQGVHRIPAAVQPFYDSYPVLTEHLPGSTNTQAFHELVAVAKTWIPGIRISDNTTTSTPGQVFAVISNHPLRGQPLDTTSLQLWLVSTTNDDLVQQCRTP